MKKINLIPKFLRRNKVSENESPEKPNYSRKIKHPDDEDDENNFLGADIGNGIF